VRAEVNRADRLPRSASSRVDKYLVPRWCLRPITGIENKVVEWNIYVDPHAAAVVFNSGAPITLVPLDATNDVPLTLEFYKRLERDCTTAVAEFVYQALAAQEAHVGSGSYYLWDPLAAAVVSEEDVATFQTIPLLVIEEEGPAASGRTLEREAGSSIRVAVTADRARFEPLFLDTINGRLP
jgi:pyrimidine-specific ribonucleoside hydrolase